MTLRIGNGAGFLGDQIDAPRRLVEAAELDYLTLEYLAELTMSILAAQRQKNPQAGFARDFLDVLRSLLHALQAQPQLKVITNAGGVNPRALVAKTAGILVQQGLADMRLAAVEGDDLLPQFTTLDAAGHRLEHLDTGQPFRELGKQPVAANAYFGAAPLVAALERDARVVITGRVADASLTVAPAIHHFQWSWNSWPALAGASVAGHLIECGAQVTGGYSQRWQLMQLADVGYPIAEIDATGSAVITKPPGSGGRVDRQSVVEQLVYEIGDPRCYKTPDVNVDFTTVAVKELGHDRVLVSGAQGKPPSDFYKVSLAYHDGYTASAQLLVAGRDCLDKAKHCTQIVQRRLLQAGCDVRVHAEYLGSGATLCGTETISSLNELVARWSVWHADRAVVERFTREIAPLITSGPAGLAGYASARSPVREVFAYWPALIAKEAVQPAIEVRTAQEWTEQ